MDRHNQPPGEDEVQHAEALQKFINSLKENYLRLQESTNANYMAANYLRSTNALSSSPVAPLAPAELAFAQYREQLRVLQGMQQSDYNAELAINLSGQNLEVPSAINPMALLPSVPENLEILHHRQPFYAQNEAAAAPAYDDPRFKVPEVPRRQSNSKSNRKRSRSTPYQAPETHRPPVEPSAPSPFQAGYPPWMALHGQNIQQQLFSPWLGSQAMELNAMRQYMYSMAQMSQMAQESFIAPSSVPPLVPAPTPQRPLLWHQPEPQYLWHRPEFQSRPTSENSNPVCRVNFDSDTKDNNDPT